MGTAANQQHQSAQQIEALEKLSSSSDFVSQLLKVIKNYMLVPKEDRSRITPLYKDLETIANSIQCSAAMGNDMGGPKFEHRNADQVFTFKIAWQISD